LLSATLLATLLLLPGLRLSALLLLAGLLLSALLLLAGLLVRILILIHHSLQRWFGAPLSSRSMAKGNARTAALFLYGSCSTFA
jgi:hypothetical protein